MATPGAVSICGPMVATSRMSPNFSALLVFGIVLSFPHLSSCQCWSVFQQKHIRSAAITCNVEMNQALYYIKGQCKPVNTFIISPPRNVQTLCTGITRSQDVLSPAAFTLNNCNYASGLPTNCVYNSRPMTDKICVRCENQLPVHFAGVKKC
ncbi:sialic acid-binding lectin-like [Hyperolius riggenbachi]|uniref:sialic acid-binding lectin-like n=1 Tax=Hyperolius riggenbachi TaxID=752182 RepID=UPI0035A3086E